MNVMHVINTFFGVEPPSLKRRIMIGCIAIIAAVIILIATIVSTNVAFGSKNFIDTFISSLVGAQAPHVSQTEPYSVTRLIYFMSLILIAFVLSIIYYMLLPWKTVEQKTEAFREEGLHKYY
jgi:hypothetical protein